MINTVPKDIEAAMLRICKHAQLSYYNLDWRLIERNRDRLDEWDYWALSIFAQARGEWVAEEPLTAEELETMTPRIKRDEQGRKMWRAGTNDYEEIRKILCAAGMVSAWGEGERYEQAKK